ncbi:centromere protein J [Anopheles marshallii]|uniref:centromere protein J n=1 Tax=Anopheles marshallii TaxID=1521116 RepID=UPI00237AB4D3|nr:centromere protein J [Anopheles marshallii]
MAESPRSILVRLKQLKHWQEEQQRVLLEKHLAQQQLLEREQQKMYEVLGLRQQTNEDGGGQLYEDSGSEPEYEETNLQAQLATERLQESSVKDDTTIFDSDAEQPTVEQEQALKRASNIPKKRFLKRGEGLRARFKVDPDKFKLENLPKYKFANHNRERNNWKSGTKQEQSAGGSLEAPKVSRVSNGKSEKTKQTLNEKKGRTRSDQGIVLDVNRVQDKKLDTRRRMGGSFPLIGKTDTNNDNADNEDDDQLFGNIVTSLKITDVENIVQKPRVIPDVPWKQRLDPMVPPKISKEQRDLNFFEQLEEKVVGKSFNSNSSSILRFIAANESTVNDDGLTNDDTISSEQIVNDPLVRQEDIALKDRLLAPPPSRTVLNAHDSDDSNEDHAHVRFIDDEESSESSDEDESDVTTDHETYNHMQGIASSKMSTPNDKVIVHPRSLEQTGQNSERSDEEESKGCPDEDGTVDSANGQSEAEDTPVAGFIGDETLRSEILAKSELLKERLTELEREIDNYRRENAELIQAKQEHELERLKLQQDREEMEEHMNDERIKMEVYFHDERMKIETERKQALREAQKPNKKDKEEIMRLNEELAEVRRQQKEREAKHSATLARFRSQLKTVEKEMQEVRLELEVTKKDNRRLETENTRLKRQNNSRMLVEINRNIAKLATGGSETVEQQVSKEDPKRSSLLAKSKKGAQSTNRSKPPQIIQPKERKVPTQVTRVKVTNHQTVARGKPTSSRGKTLPVREDNLTSETDENDENGFYPNDGSSDEQFSPRKDGNSNIDEENDEDDDDDEADDVLGEYSSSAQEGPIPSSYFPKNPAVRKTLFNAINLNEDTPAAPTRQGLVRKENPTTQCDLLDRTPEAAELIKSMKREIVNVDGSRDIWYPNGNLKKISPDGMIIRMLYFNKDIKETNMTEGTTKYYYFETNTWHTTYLDGLEILEFPDGQTEHRFKDGSTEVHFSNGSIRTTNPNSADITEEWKYPDGTMVIIRKNDDKEINLPNGQVEIHTKAHKRRIYPDGTIKFVYPDGSQESRYSNGRIRLKDKDGRLLSDTGGGTGAT